MGNNGRAQFQRAVRSFVQKSTRTASNHRPHQGLAQLALALASMGLVFLIWGLSRTTTGAATAGWIFAAIATGACITAWRDLAFLSQRSSPHDDALLLEAVDSLLHVFRMCEPRVMSENDQPVTMNSYVSWALERRAWTKSDAECWTSALRLRSQVLRGEEIAADVPVRQFVRKLQDLNIKLDTAPEPTALRTLQVAPPLPQKNVQTRSLDSSAPAPTPKLTLLSRE